jgi:type I restriction enzyme S subunit
MRTGHTPSRSVPDYWVDTDIPWFTLADVWQLRDLTRIYLGETATRISRLGLDNSAAELLPTGTVVLSRTASIGFTGIMPVPMATSQDFWNWVCGPRLLPEYLVQVFRAMRAELQAMQMGSTHQTIYQHVAAVIRIPLPPIDEQRAIIEYLDTETTKIDTLIGKQERLIETLRERRAATIDAAFSKVTDRTPLKTALVFAQTGPFGTQLSADEYINGGVPVINPTHIKANCIVPDHNVTISDGKAQALARHRVKLGDLVLGRKGEVDKSALVDESSVGYVCGSDAMLLRPRSSVTVPKYLWWFFQSPTAHRQLELWSVGSTVAGLNQTTMTKVSLPHPALEEQRRIADHLAERVAKIDALVASTQRFIELARERRAALITAAVTGQIDVRAARSVA